MLLSSIKPPSIPRKTANGNGKPKCNNCKYSVFNNGQLECKLFKSLNDFNFYSDTIYCRTDENLCGPDGKYFKER